MKIHKKITENKGALEVLLGRIDSLTEPEIIKMALELQKEGLVYIGVKEYRQKKVKDLIYREDTHLSDFIILLEIPPEGRDIYEFGIAKSPQKVSYGCLGFSAFMDFLKNDQIRLVETRNEREHYMADGLEILVKPEEDVWKKHNKEKEDCYLTGISQQAIYAIKNKNS